VLPWLSLWNEVQTWCHCYSLSLASVKCRLVLSFWHRLTRVVLDRGPLNRCVYSVNISIQTEHQKWRLASPTHRGKEAEDNMVWQTRQTRDVGVTRQVEKTQQSQDNDAVTVSRTQTASNAVDMATQHFYDRKSVETTTTRCCVNGDKWPHCCWPFANTTTTIPFNGLFSRTTWVSRYQKVRTSLDSNEAREDGVLGWQWHQLDHMRTTCTSL